MTPIWSIHPSTSAIAALADGELSGPRRNRVTGHLASCMKCQRTLAFHKSVAAAAPGLLAAAPPSDLVERAIASRSANRRVLLPSGDPEPVSRSVAGAGRKLIIAAAAVLAIAVTLTTRAPRLSASDVESELILTPAKPRVGQTIVVRYRPAVAALAGRQELVLRARLRTRNSSEYDEGVQITSLATLRVEKDGYSGRFVLPDSVVFASLAVEAKDGSVVDDRRGRAWELLFHDGAGQPLFLALKQRIHDLLGRSWEDARETGTQMVALYPDQIVSWNLQRFFEVSLGKTTEAATIDSQIARLERAARAKQRVSGDELAAYLWLTIRDTSASRYWVERTEREAPKHGMAATYRALIFARAHYGQPRIALAWLDSLWGPLQPVDWQVADRLTGAGLELAELINDDSTYLRWSQRRLSAMPWLAASRAIATANRPALRPEGMRLLRAALVAPARPRKLEENVAQHDQAVAASRRRVLAALGRALIATGEKRAGLDTLELAARKGWDLSLFRDVLKARLDAGDVSGAQEMAALIVADPRTPPALADSITRSASRDEGRWTAAVAAARERLRAFTLSKTVDLQVRGAARVLDAAGNEVALDSLLGERESVVVFWSRYCAPALEALGALDSTASRLSGAGIPLILIVDEKPSPEFQAFMRQKGASVRVVHDVKGEAKLAYGNFGTPSQYVLDANRRIRFRDEGVVADLPVQLEALKQERAGK
jgi:hypothetical protein